MTSVSSRPAVARFLVCAGSTRETIDEVRDWGNIFTGGTGFDVARALARYGDVDLLTSNATHRTLLDGLGGAIRAFAFRTHADLLAGIDARMQASRYDAICMSAAVSDYTPDGCFSVTARAPGGDGEIWSVRSVQAGKVSSAHSTIAVLGRPTEKLVDRFRRVYGYTGVLVKFKLEVGLSAADLQRVGEASRRASAADLLVANTLAMVEGDQPGAWILGAGAPRWSDRSALATTLADLVAERLALGGVRGGAARDPLLHVMATQCQDLADLVRRVPAGDYAACVDDSCIGAHIRHGIDHQRAILSGLSTGVVDYEQRSRGWAGERDPLLACQTLVDLAVQWQGLGVTDLARPIQVRCRITAQQTPIVVPSTVAREVLFALSHDIHHAAILARRFAALGLQVPAGFGLAPSTIAFRTGAAVATSV